MFKCAVGNHDSAPREKLRRIVQESRAVVYLDGSKGWEIVHEGHFCERHFVQANKAMEVMEDMIK